MAERGGLEPQPLVESLGLANRPGSLPGSLSMRKAEVLIPMPLRARTDFESGLVLDQFTFHAENGGVEPHPFRDSPLSKRATGHPVIILQTAPPDTPWGPGGAYAEGGGVEPHTRKVPSVFKTEPAAQAGSPSITRRGRARPSSRRRHACSYAMLSASPSARGESSSSS